MATTTTLMRPDLSTFGARLAALEHAHGWNHKEAARICGFPAASWRNWLKGQRPHNYDEVCRQISDRAGIDLIWLAQPQAVRALVEEVLSDYDERTLSGALPALEDPQRAARSVFDSVAGYGPLQPYLDDPTVEELWINAPSLVR